MPLQKFYTIQSLVARGCAPFQKKTAQDVLEFKYLNQQKIWRASTAGRNFQSVEVRSFPLNAFVFAPIALLPSLRRRCSIGVGAFLFLRYKLKTERKTKGRKPPFSSFRKFRHWREPPKHPKTSDIQEIEPAEPSGPARKLLGSIHVFENFVPPTQQQRKQMANLNSHAYCRLLVTDPHICKGQ